MPFKLDNPEGRKRRGPTIPPKDRKKEIWRQIEGLDWDHTEWGWSISNMGRVAENRTGTAPKRRIILEPRHTTRGYVVTIRHDKVRHEFTVHDLVRQYFTDIPNANELQFKDGDMFNVKASNMQRKTRSKLLGEWKIKEIKYRSTVIRQSCKEIAKEMELPYMTVHDTLSGKVNKGVTLDVEKEGDLFKYCRIPSSEENT